MRLLYFTRRWTGHDERFARGFRDRGIELGIVTLQSGPAPMLAACLRAKESFVRSLNLRDPLDELTAATLAEEYAKLEREFGPDIVLAGPLTDCGYIKALARTAVPFVAQSWAFDVLWEARNEGLNGAHCRLALTRCSGLFADCACVVAECQKLCGGPLEKTFVMPWGIEAGPCGDDEQRTRMRDELQLTGKYVFLHTRGLEPVYFVETLLGAFRELHKVHPEAVLLLASSGSLASMVKHFVDRSNLSKAVNLLGNVAHETILGVFLAADCYVSCAASDGTSISMLEAMRARLPIIVSDVGGNPEWIQNNSNGWITPVGDTSSLIHAMVDAIEIDPDCRARFVDQNSCLVRERANWAENFSAFHRFLQVCSRDSGSSILTQSRADGF